MTAQRRPVSRRGRTAPAATRNGATGNSTMTVDEVALAPDAPADPGADRPSEAAIRAQRAEERRYRAPEESSRGSVLTERSGRVRRLYDDTRGEVRKVTWPDRDTTRNLTLVVIGVSVVMGILLGGIDFVLFQIFEALP